MTLDTLAHMHLLLNHVPTIGMVAALGILLLARPRESRLRRPVEQLKRSTGGLHRIAFVTFVAAATPCPRTALWRSS